MERLGRGGSRLIDGDGSKKPVHWCLQSGDEWSIAVWTRGKIHELASLLVAQHCGQRSACAQSDPIPAGIQPVIQPRM